MPDNTRPRYVNPPADFLSPAPTPYVEPQGDPYGGLLATLNNLTQGIQPVNQPGKLETILNAFAQAAAVGASQDPGAALQGQLNQHSAIQQLQKKQQFEQQQKIQDLMLQIQLQKAQDITTQKNKLTDFQREAAFRKEEREATQTFNANEERDKERRQFGVDSIKRDWKIEDQEKEIRLQKQIEKEFLGQDLDRLTKSEAVRNIDERRAARDQKQVYYMMAGISAENAKLMADSYINGNELTPSQSKLLDRATKFYSSKAAQSFAAELEKDKAQAYHYRKSGDAAGAQKLAYDRMDRAFDETTARALAGLADEEFILMKDGSFQKFEGMYKQLGTLPPGAARKATTQENIAQQSKLYEAYRQSAEQRKADRGGTPTVPGVAAPSGSPTPQPTAIPTPNAAPGAPATELENMRMQVGQELQRQRDVLHTPPEKINALLDEMIKKYPQYTQLYEGYKIRTVDNPTAKSAPSASPTPTPQSGPSVDEYTQKRRAAINKSNLFGGGSGSQVRKVSPEERKLLDEVEKNRAAWETAKKAFNQRNP